MLFNHGRLPTPFGGPASGLWPSGGGSAPAAPPSPPLPCVAPDILSDLFAACSGVISPGSPGPICGWTYFMSFSGPAGTITFIPGSMRFNCPTSNEAPAASKSISMVGVNNRTVEFTFREFDDLGGSISYQVLILDAGNANLINIDIQSNGDTIVTVGPQANASTYVGQLALNKGRHVVHLTMDNAGIPLLWVDGVKIPLTFNSSGPFGGGYPADSVVANFLDLSNDAISRTATLESLFIATGQFPPTRAFCRQ